MKAKYLSGNHPSKDHWNNGNSHWWKELCEIKEVSETNIHWNVGEWKYVLLV